VEEIVRGYEGRVTHEAMAEAVRIVTSQFLEALPALAVTT